MNELLTWDEVNGMYSKLMDTSKEYESCNELICEDELRGIDVVLIKKRLMDLFNKFRNCKYMVSYSVIDNMRLIPSYERHEGQIPRRNVSQVEKAVTERIDKQIWMTEFYQSLMVVASKLTEAETVYLINTFITSKTEEVIAEKLNICKTSLQKIKKSCLVKAWIELRVFYKEE